MTTDELLHQHRNGCSLARAELVVIVSQWTPNADIVVARLKSNAVEGSDLEHFARSVRPTQKEEIEREFA